jgi:hypothetical protein
MTVLALLIVTTVAVRGLKSQTPTTPTASTPAPDPHWKPDGCAHCHQVKEGVALPIPPESVDAICLDCHDGVRATRDAHPIGRAFAGDQLHHPEGWPTIDERIGCATCHQIEDAPDHDRPRPRDNPAFLRGFETRRLLDFCAHCHLDLDVHGAYNPHVMLDAGGEIIERSCRYCHHSLIDQRHRLVREADPALRTDGITLCLGCHRRHIEYFDPGHIGATVTPEIKRRMTVMESHPQYTDDAGTIDWTTTRRADESLRFPLGPNDRLVCATCHNPHQVGVFPPDSVLALGAIQTGHERETLRLRGFGKELCVACHDK